MTAADGAARGPAEDGGAAGPPPSAGARALPRFATPLDDADPEMIGPWVLRGRLGVGGMGRVYLAEGGDGGWAAVKTMHPHLTGDSGLRARFAREVANARRVDSPYTPAVLDADTHQPYLVTEFVDGPTLDRRIVEHGPLAPPDLQALAVNVLHALTALHRAGIVHRDLKPSNIILSRTGPRVIDLGVSRALDDLVGLTVGDQRPGTPQLMAPEQWEGRAPTEAADVFAWAGMVVYAGTGRWAFTGRTEDELRHAVLHGRPRLDGLPPRLRPVVAAAFCKDPAARPTPIDVLRRLGGARAPLDRPEAGSGPESGPGEDADADAAGRPQTTGLLRPGSAAVARPRALDAGQTERGGSRGVEWWNVWRPCPRLLTPAVCGITAGAASGLATGDPRYALATGLVLAVAADPRVAGRATHPTRALLRRPRLRTAAAGMVAAPAVGLLAGAAVAALAGASFGTAFAAAFTAVMVPAAALLPSLAAPADPGLPTRDPPSVRRDLVASVAGGLAVAVSASLVLGLSHYLAGQVTGGFFGVKEGGLGGVELAVNTARASASAMLELGLGLGAWWVLAGSWGRLAVARAWLGARRRRMPRRSRSLGAAYEVDVPGRGASVRPTRRSTAGRGTAAAAAVVVLGALGGLLFVNRIDGLDRCDGPNGRRARALHIWAGGEGRAWLVEDSVELGRMRVDLRYSAAYGCVWAGPTGAPGRAEAWLDRSWDGGRTWEARLALRRFSDGSYTETHPLSGGAIRACGKVADSPEIDCTEWYPPEDPAP